jgi:hypothetical protein
MFHADGQTDGYDKVNSPFRNHANAPKNGLQHNSVFQDTALNVNYMSHVRTPSRWYSEEFFGIHLTSDAVTSQKTGILDYIAMKTSKVVHYHAALSLGFSWCTICQLLAHAGNSRSFRKTTQLSCAC